MTHARASNWKRRVDSPVGISELAPRPDEAALEPLREALLEFGGALARLRWHSQDDYAQALIAACAQTAERFAAALVPAGEPASLVARFAEQESCTGLIERCRILGERALAAYDHLLRHPAPAGSGLLERQRAELGEVVALLEPLSRMLCTERLLVDTRLEAALAGC